MKYGSQVAFLWSGAIRFGVLSAIVTRNDKDGEKTSYVIETDTATGVETFTINDEENLVEIEPRYPSLIGDRVAKLFARSEDYIQSAKASDAIHNPPEPAPTEVVITTPPHVIADKDIPF